MSKVDERRSETARPVFLSPAQARTTKIDDCHLQRKAIVYVRQSTEHQVRENKESTARQYALVDVAIELGWPADQVIVIDEDQARTAATADGRYGFHRLLAEVGLDHVGIILGIELCRLARSNKDWSQLIELCGIFRTVLADHDGLYDPTDFNDRLLLGLRGIMSEAELHILRGRMHEGKVNKAKRGELVTSLPVGYYRADGDEIVFDPDEQVQTVVRLIFAKFEEFRSAAAVLRYFVQHKITIGIREHAGPERGELRWRRPKSGMILAILKHPIYTGAYVYGRRTTDQRRRARGMSSGSTPSPNKEDWQVFLPDKLPAYITWDQFCSNQKQLKKNRARMEAMGAAREGLPLLGGLVFCGRCGCRMVTCFKNRTLFRYVCCQKQMMYGDARCQNLAGRVVDALITEKVLTALEPAALDLSLQAVTDLNTERERLHTHWKQRLEGARYNTDRAFRQYNATEPENRLVARTLEKRWEKALHDQQQLEEEYEQFCRSQPNQLTEDDQAMIRELSSSIPALWNSTATSQVDRKTIVRHLIERIVVAVQGETEIVTVTVHWAGGFRSEHEIRRPVRSHEQLQDFQRLKKRIEELFDSGMPPAEIADRINHEGFRPPNRCAQFSGRAIWCFLRDQCGRGSRTYKLTELNELGPDEWLLADLAKELGIKMQNIHAWLRRGWVTGRQIASTQSHWILWADKSELERLRQLSDLTYRDRPYPKSLTTPRRAPPKE